MSEPEVMSVPAAHLAELPLFPLPSAVLFPHTLLPLHIFEPRYRAMTRFCIENRWPMAVAQIRPQHVHDQAGDPPVASVAGVGELVYHQRTDDGRYSIVLRGVARVRLLHELPKRGLYRRAAAEVLGDHPRDPDDDLPEQVLAIHACLTALKQRWPQAAAAVDQTLLTNGDPASLSNILSAALFPDAEARQGLLACRDIGARLTRVMRRLVEILAASGDGERLMN